MEFTYQRAILPVVKRHLIVAELVSCFPIQSISDRKVALHRSSPTGRSKPDQLDHGCPLSVPSRWTFVEVGPAGAVSTTPTQPLPITKPQPITPLGSGR